MQAQPPGREQEPGSAAPYPPQAPYRGQSPYQAPAQSGPGQAGPGPYDVPGAYGDQGQGHGDAGPAARPHGAGTAYPPRPPQPAATQAEGADPLAPLPAHAP